MRIVHLTPGTGDSFYCENCIRDAALVTTMRSLGHDVLIIPMYLPMRGDKNEATHRFFSAASMCTFSRSRRFFERHLAGSTVSLTHRNSLAGWLENLK